MGRPPRAVRAPRTPWASAPPAWAVWAAREDALEAARARLYGKTPHLLTTKRRPEVPHGPTVPHLAHAVPQAAYLRRRELLPPSDTAHTIPHELRAFSGSCLGNLK